MPALRDVVYPVKIYMAGGVSANLNPFWKETCNRIEQGQTYENATEDSMRIFLAGGESRHWIQDELLESKKKNGAEMQLYIAGIQGSRKGFVVDASISRGRMALEKWGGYDSSVKEYRPYILESFFYCDADTERLLPYFGDFLLDSGAFTFMQGKGGSPNWDEYVERYADFINRNNVDKFFELDIDSVTGYDHVKRLRSRLESLTGKQSIPVWHRSRGKDEFEGLCKEYPYVALGGLVDGAKKGEYARSLWKFFPWFISTAHNNGAKIHALGFTSLDGIKQYHFDSVDSTAWASGNRFGFLYFFDGQTMQKRDVPKGHRIKDAKAAALHNYTEWIKFQRYALTHL